jgi:Domain of unknown function (DUF4166)
MAGRADRRDVREDAADLVPSALVDLRFRNLLARADWDALPASTRKRFSKRLADGATVVYFGEVLETRLKFAGWFFAQLARLLGGPLPLFTDAHVPAIVTVSVDMKTGGQIWTRLYARRNGFPQAIQSSKQFTGPTGLEEYVGQGVGMALTTHRVENALQFRSAHYFFRAGSLRLVLPRWMTPGALTVTHQESGDGRFVFTLEIVHHLFGRIVAQRAIFRDVVS